MAGLFLVSLFFTPLFVAIPKVATAPALLVIGALMMKSVADIEWSDMASALPAFLCIVVMPLTFSIANGISVAILSYVLIHVASGRARELSPVLVVIAVLLPIFYVLAH